MDFQREKAAKVQETLDTCLCSLRMCIKSMATEEDLQKLQVDGTVVSEVCKPNIQLALQFSQNGITALRGYCVFTQ